MTKQVFGMSRIFRPPEVRERELRFTARFPESIHQKLVAMAEWQTEVRKAMDPPPKEVVMSANDALVDIIGWAWDESQTEMKEWEAKRQELARREKKSAKK